MPCNSTQLKLEKVRLLIESALFEDAKALLDDIRKANTNNPNFWLVQALYDDNTNNRQQATTALTKALQLDADFHQAMLYLYELALMGGDKQAFIDRAEATLQTSPDNLLTKNLLAQFYFVQQDFDKATALYKSLLDEDKTFNRAIVLNKLAIMALHDNINDAHKYIEQAFEINSTNPDILDTLGWILVQKGQLEDGLGHLRKAFARDSNNPEIRYHIGYALAKLNRNQEAKEELKKAVAVERPFYNRSKAQALLDSL